MNFNDIGFELDRVTKTLHLLIASAPYAGSVDEAAIVRQTINILGVKPLVWVVNELTGDQPKIEESDFQMTVIPRSNSIAYQSIVNLNIAKTFLNDPFLNDSRQEFRDSAVANVAKARLLILDTLEALTR